MGLLSNNNNFKPGYKKRPFDEYKATISKLDEETKKNLDRQRTTGMILVVVFVFALIVILAVTGIGVDKTKSLSGNVFADKESVLIECFGDSITKGDMLLDGQKSYPEELSFKLPELLNGDGNKYKCKKLDVRNYGINGSIIKSDSYTRLSGNADIVIILYSVNNFAEGADYEGTLEANIETITKQGSKIFLLNYPIKKDSQVKDELSQANNYIKSVSEKMGITLFDVNSYFESYSEAPEEELYAIDGVHLTEKGYMLMGDFVAKSIHKYYQEVNE